MTDNLSFRDQRVVWHPFTQSEIDGPAIPIVRGEGARLIAEDGSEYLDAISSWWAVLFGHAHPYISERLSDQMQRLHHVVFSGFTHEPAVELSERVLKALPGSYSKVFYSDNGSTCCEVALKLAVQHWFNRGERRPRIVAFENAYHGDTFGCMSVGEADGFTEPFWPMLFEVDRIPAPVAGREEESYRKLLAILDKEETAAFIFEPLIQGAGGMLMFDPEGLDPLLALCRDRGIFTIADEVMTGFGRTGTDFACDQLQNTPDMICLSKGLTGGTMALGATVTTEAVFQGFLSSDRMRAMLHGHTFTANPLACTAGLASLDLYERPETVEARNRISSRHAAFASSIAGCAGASQVRVKGVVLALEIGVAREGYSGSLRDSLYSFFLEQRILLRPLGNTIYILPPYCITDEELARVYVAIETAIQKYGKGQG